MNTGVVACDPRQMRHASGTWTRLASNPTQQRPPLNCHEGDAKGGGGGGPLSQRSHSRNRLPVLRGIAASQPSKLQGTVAVAATRFRSQSPSMRRLGRAAAAIFEERHEASLLHAKPRKPVTHQFPALSQCTYEHVSVAGDTTRTAGVFAPLSQPPFPFWRSNSTCRGGQPIGNAGAANKDCLLRSTSQPRLVPRTVDPGTANGKKHTGSTLPTPRQPPPILPPSSVPLHQRSVPVRQTSVPNRSEIVPLGQTKTMERRRGRDPAPVNDQTRVVLRRQVSVPRQQSSVLRRQMSAPTRESSVPVVKSRTCMSYQRPVWDTARVPTNGERGSRRPATATCRPPTAAARRKISAPVRQDPGATSQKLTISSSPAVPAPSRRGALTGSMKQSPRSASVTTRTAVTTGRQTPRVGCVSSPSSFVSGGDGVDRGVQRPQVPASRSGHVRTELRKVQPPSASKPKTNAASSTPRERPPHLRRDDEDAKNPRRVDAVSQIPIDQGSHHETGEKSDANKPAAVAKPLEVPNHETPPGAPQQEASAPSSTQKSFAPDPPGKTEGAHPEPQKTAAQVDIASPKLPVGSVCGADIPQSPGKVNDDHAKPCYETSLLKSLGVLDVPCSNAASPVTTSAPTVSAMVEAPTSPPPAVVPALSNPDAHDLLVIDRSQTIGSRTGDATEQASSPQESQNAVRVEPATTAAMVDGVSSTNLHQPRCVANTAPVVGEPVTDDHTCPISTDSERESASPKCAVSPGQPTAYEEGYLETPADAFVPSCLSTPRDPPPDPYLPHTPRPCEAVTQRDAHVSCPKPAVPTCASFQDHGLSETCPSQTPLPRSVSQADEGVSCPRTAKTVEAAARVPKTNASSMTRLAAPSDTVASVSRSVTDSMTVDVYPWANVSAAGLLRPRGIVSRASIQDRWNLTQEDLKKTTMGGEAVAAESPILRRGIPSSAAATATTYLEYDQLPPPPHGLTILTLRQAVVDLLGTSEEDWKPQFDALTRIQCLARHAPLFVSQHLLNDVMPAILRCTTSLRSGLSKNGVLTLHALIRGLPGLLGPWMNDIVPTLIGRAAMTGQKFVSTAATAALQDLCAPPHVSLDVMTGLCQGRDVKSSSVNQKKSVFLKSCLEHMIVGGVTSSRPPLRPPPAQVDERTFFNLSDYTYDTATTLAARDHTRCGRGTTSSLFDDDHMTVTGTVLLQIGTMVDDRSAATKRAAKDMIQRLFDANINYRGTDIGDDPLTAFTSWIEHTLGKTAPDTSSATVKFIREIRAAVRTKKPTPPPSRGMRCNM